MIRVHRWPLPLLAALAVAPLAMVLAACSGGDEPDPTPTGTPSATDTSAVFTVRPLDELDTYRYTLAATMAASAPEVWSILPW